MDTTANEDRGRRRQVKMKSKEDGGCDKIMAEGEEDRGRWTEAEEV
jgi:hypothetical protein